MIRLRSRFQPARDKINNESPILKSDDISSRLYHIRKKKTYCIYKRNENIDIKKIIEGKISTIYKHFIIRCCLNKNYSLSRYFTRERMLCLTCILNVFSLYLSLNNFLYSSLLWHNGDIWDFYRDDISGHLVTKQQLFNKNVNSVERIIILLILFWFIL